MIRRNCFQFFESSLIRDVVASIYCTRFKRRLQISGDVSRCDVSMTDSNQSVK